MWWVPGLWNCPSAQGCREQGHTDRIQADTPVGLEALCSLLKSWAVSAPGLLLKGGQACDLNDPVSPGALPSTGG